MKKDMDKRTATSAIEEIKDFNESVKGDLTVDGNLVVNGKIRSTSENGVGVINPNDDDASAYLGFFENNARIRLRGDGIGANGAFQIQGTSDAVRLSVEPDGTTVNGKLEVKDNATVDGTLDVEDKVTAPEFLGDLSGNATTASTLQTPRRINGVSFDGSESITLPEQTDIKGNAETATKLQNTRTISLIGGATGSATFDGSANATINTTVAPSGHQHTINQVTGLQSELDNRALTDHTHTPEQIRAASSTHDHSNATDTEDGFMSKEDKARLDLHISDTYAHITPEERGRWNNVAGDTGWINLPLLNDVRAWNETVDRPQYRRVGNVVYLRGSFTNITRITLNCATLPSGFRPSGQAHYFVQNTTPGGGVAQFARWIIRTNGNIELQHSSHSNVVETQWFTIHTSFLID